VSAALTSNKPILSQTETARDKIVIVAEFPRQKPETVFDYWTTPELLKKWWPPVAELEPRLGGTYHFSWPNQDWHLRGKFTNFARGRSLEFSWRWDHDPSDTTNLTVSLERIPNGGTRLRLHHSKYPDTEEGKKAREGHIEGWMFFLKKLQEV